MAGAHKPVQAKRVTAANTRPKVDALDPKAAKRAFRAIERDDAGALQELLAAGLSPDVTFDPSEKYGAQSALCFALNRSKLACARALLAANARVDLVEPRGGTPLHYVSDSVILEQLIASGADVNARNAKGQTPLHMACDISSTRIAQLLLAHGADATAVNARGETPHDLASDPALHALLERMGSR